MKGGAKLRQLARARVSLVTVFGFLGSATGALVCTSISADAAWAAPPPVFYQTSNSGWEVNGTSVSPSSVSAHFTVPTVSGCGTPVRSVAFGVLEEDSAGSANSVVEPFVQLDCPGSGGQAHISAGMKLSGVVTIFPTTITPGDAIAVSASATTSGTALTFTDTTTGFTQSATGAGITPYFAYVGSFPRRNTSGALLGVPRFTQFAFTNAQVNGANMNTFTGATGLAKLIRTTNGSAPPSGIVQIQPAALAAASFNETWRHQ
jgi:hypothetical protein